MSRLMPWYADFTQVPKAGLLAGVAAASVFDTITPHGNDRYFPPFLRVGVLLTGAITNTEITIGVGITDENGLTMWTPAATQEVRTLPGGAVIVGMFTFPTLHAAGITVALEAAITGGGSAQIYTCFSDENL